MSNSIGIGKRNMSNSIEFGRPKINLSVRRSDLNCTQKKWLVHGVPRGGEKEKNVMVWGIYFWYRYT